MIAGHHSLMGGAAKGPLVVPRFSGASQQYAYCTTPSINNSNPLTFGGWFRMYEGSSENVWLICGWSQSGSWGSTHFLSTSVRFGTGSSSGMHSFSVALPFQKWMHLVATYTGSAVIVYKDGEVYQSWSTGSQTRANNDSSFRIASFNEGSLKYASVAACNVFVANKGITAEEVSALYKAYHIGNVGYLSSNVYGAWDMTDVESGATSFPSAVGGTALSVSGGYALVDSPWARNNVPYIRSSGLYKASAETNNGGSYINTGINPTSSTKVEMKCRIVPGSNFQQWTYLFGAQTSNDNANTFALRANGSDATYPPWTNYRFGHSAWHDLGFRVTGWGVSSDWHTITADRSMVTVDGVSVNTSSYVTSSSLPGYPIYLGAINRSGSAINSFAIDIAYCKIWNGSTLVFDGTAAERNGAAGLYDSVSSSLFSSSQTSYPYSFQP